MEEVTERTLLPYSAVCYITVTYPDGASIRGSGVIVGPNDVLTAMHVVYQADHGGWAVNVSVTPGADTVPSIAPFGSFTDWGSLDAPTADWDPNGDALLTDAESQRDMAVIGLKTRIGDVAGWLPPAPVAEDFEGVMLGYPAHPPSGVGIGMMAESVLAQASDAYGVYDIDSALGSGASGGPLLYSLSGQNVVAGVLSSGTLDGSRSTYAAFDGDGTWDWLTETIAANDTLLAPDERTAWVGTDGADVLSGNALDNDVLAGQGDDAIDGAAGIDTAFFTGARAQYAVTSTASALQVDDAIVGRDGSDTMVRVERLAFDDVALAFDLIGNAGVVARCLGAVFGPDAVGNTVYAGIGLWHLDHGMSAEQLMALALQVRLGPAASDADVVALLYSQVAGSAPTPDQAAYYEGWLATGQVSQAGLGLYAAQTEVNAAHIGLAGLAAMGLAYQPLAG